MKQKSEADVATKDSKTITYPKWFSSTKVPQPVHVDLRQNTHKRAFISEINSTRGKVVYLKESLIMHIILIIWFLCMTDN